MKRRRLLSLSALALSGCASTAIDGDEAGPTSPTQTTTSTTETATPTGTPTKTLADESVERLGVESITTRDGLTLTVSDCWVQHSIIYANVPDALTVASHEGTQFVFALVSADNDLPPPRSEFAVSLGGTDYWAKSEFEGELLESVDSDRDVDYYQTRDEDWESYGHGWLLFEIPDDPRGEMTIRWHGHDADASWSLTDERVAALTAPRPQFEVVEFDAPERVVSTPFELSLTVRNVGEGDGVFRGVLNQRGVAVLAWFTLPVPAGETRTWRYDYRHDAERLALHWDGGVVERNVEIES
ncbi:hypothetical protein [Haladaptatus sp. NG-WS-4]